MKTCGPLAATATIVLGFGAVLVQDVSFGERLFRDKADCQFCHGIDGDGRGDPRSPGRAANLHETHLNREQLVEVIACGRPGTEMPHFDKYAYEDTNCYELGGRDLDADAPYYPHSTPLTRCEIEAVADYIIRHSSENNRGSASIGASTTRPTGREDGAGRIAFIQACCKILPTHRKSSCRSHGRVVLGTLYNDFGTH